MTQLYYYVILLDAIVCLALAVVAFLKNRHQAVGPLFGLAMLLTSIWLASFAQYFRPMRPSQALFWAGVTLSSGILSPALYFHSVCELVGKARRLRWWIALSYVVGVAFVVVLWLGHVIDGLKTVPYMHHYIKYDRFWYPLVVLQITGWQWFGLGVLISSARHAIGYKRTQLIYFIVAWFVWFLTANAIIIPIEYNLSIPPFAFFILPLNMGSFAYAVSQARFADFNVVIARVLLYTVTLFLIALVSFAAIAGMVVVAPGFMNPQQILFALVLIMVIGLGLTTTLPRFLPRAERMMQERMFGKRHGYQDTLAGLVKELSLLASIDEVLDKVATTIHSQMQLSRVLILMQDPLSGQYRLQAQCGLNVQEAEGLDLAEDSPVIRWLRENNDELVRDELERQMPAHTLAELATDLNRLSVVVCVPMTLDGHLVGLLALGEKANRDMFFISDLRVLETLATEVALAVKYRRMEDQILRKNKLIELGTIAAGVAHEIRNPLASIRTFAQLMPSKMDDPEFKNEFSKLVIKDVDRITKVVESMLAFARPTQTMIAEHLVNELVEEAVLLLQSRLKSKRIELTKQFHERPVVRVDKQQILQVLVNLLNNATDALPEQGKIRIATGIAAIEDESGNGTRRMAVIEVADNGPGIPVAVRNRLFDPFFTTKKEGTGLGLSISQKIVRDHGGLITVSSIEGKGAAFQVNLPLG
jgi:signal transduction histidine kinase